MANVSDAFQIETRIKHDLSITFPLVAGDQSLNVGTLVTLSVKSIYIGHGVKNSVAEGFMRKGGASPTATGVKSGNDPVMFLGR